MHYYTPPESDYKLGGSQISEGTELERLTIHRPYKRSANKDLNVMEGGIRQDYDNIGWVLVVISWIFVFLFFPIAPFFIFKMVQEYERAVIFRLGRILKGGAKGPGIFMVLPCIDDYKKVDLRTVSFDVPPQEILSKDSVTVSVDAVVYFRIENPIIAITQVENATSSTRLLAQTTLSLLSNGPLGKRLSSFVCFFRNVLGTHTLAEMLSDRSKISDSIERTLDEATDPWGVKVERVEVKDVRLPQQLQRAMATEAEATREARAKVVAAEGEHQASRALKEASEILSEAPAALQLRYLQTLATISAEKNSTIVFPVPMDILAGFMDKFK